MKCAYCLEAMNDAAKVCKACGRKQPLTSPEIKQRVARYFLAVVAILAVAGIGYFVWDGMARAAAISRLTGCEKFHGDQAATDEGSSAEIDEISGNGVGWRIAAKVRLTEHGCEGKW